MKLANVQSIPAHVAIEFDHGFEIVPTIVNGRATRFASIDSDGSVMAWSSFPTPVMNNGNWYVAGEDLHPVGNVGEDGGTTYRDAAESLRRITVDAILACKGIHGA